MDKILGYGLLAIGALAFLIPSSDRKKYYRLGNGDVVEESQLPQLGYIDYGNKWINGAQLQALYNLVPQLRNSFDYQSFSQNLDQFFVSFTELGNYYQQFFPTASSSDLILGEPTYDPGLHNV